MVPSSVKVLVWVPSGLGLAWSGAVSGFGLAWSGAASGFGLALSTPLSAATVESFEGSVSSLHATTKTTAATPASTVNILILTILSSCAIG